MGLVGVAKAGSAGSTSTWVSTVATGGPPRATASSDWSRCPMWPWLWATSTAIGVWRPVASAPKASDPTWGPLPWVTISPPGASSRASEAAAAAALRRSASTSSGPRRRTSALPPMATTVGPLTRDHARTRAMTASRSVGEPASADS